MLIFRSAVVLIGCLICLLPGSSLLAQEAEPVVWERELSLGYNQSFGNSESTQLQLQGRINRKTCENEFTGRARTFYSSQEDEMNEQEYFASLRYALSFCQYKWYNFYKLEAEHDKFSNVDYRIIPSIGVGYWFVDQEDYQAMAEVGAGASYAEYYDGSNESTEALLTPRAFLKREFPTGLVFSYDMTFFLSVSSLGDYRFHSETELTDPLSENLSLRFSLIDDYNAEPHGDAQRNDAKVLFSLVYSI